MIRNRHESDALRASLAHAIWVLAAAAVCTPAAAGAEPELEPPQQQRPGPTSAPSPQQSTEPASVTDPDLLPPPPAMRVVADWQQAISLLRSQAPGYATSYANIQIAEAQSRIALASVLPNLTGQGSYDHEFRTQTLTFGGTAVTIPPKDTLSVAATATWAVLSPRAFYGLGTASRNEKAAALGFAEARREMAIGLVRTMLGTLAGARIAEQNRVGLRAALERLRLTETRVAFLQGTALDVDRAEQDVAAARTQLVSGDEALRQAREALAIAVGSTVSVEAPGTLDLAGFETAVAATCRMSEDLERRPDVAEARARLEVAGRAVGDARLQFVPSLSLQSQANYSTQVSFGPQTIWNAQAILSVPIFDEARYGTLRGAELREQQARAALVSARLNALFEVAQRKRAVEVAKRQFDIARQQRDLAARIDQRTRDGYSHGFGTSLDLVTSAQALRQAEIRLVLATFQLSESRVDVVLANAECVY